MKRFEELTDEELRDEKRRYDAMVEYQEDAADYPKSEDEYESHGVHRWDFM